ncbi:fibrinogen-like protein A [Apostichopus japonicus]|uniref:Fibrinogen-like protein A n=1 Tax=Stichopus japonicus TaxID=307972 RepID=A0A2G8JQR9_STIJA|nr:fibrinogen-like protein A [Apostichopus japonicus]
MKLQLLCFFIFGVFLLEFLSVESSDEVSDVRTDKIKSRRRRDTESSSYFYYQEPEYPRDCKEVYEQCDDQTESGIFMIQPDGAPEPFAVYCNNSIDGGGWTVFLRRVDGTVNFYRDWNDYKKGFGFLRREFWLGNDNIAYLTNQGNYELRIDMNNVNGKPYYANYNLFRISDESSNYRLTDLGDYLSESTANYDAMAYNRNMSFTTRDRDNDNKSSYNCASKWYGAWWYNNCHYTHLTSLYFGATGNHQSIEWYNLPESRYNLKYAEMKLRPLP